MKNEESALPLRVLIVGCGNIAGRFDESRSQEDFPYTHAGAYRRNGCFEITACVEPDGARRSEFMQAWSVATGFESIEDAVVAGKRFDVISICTPTIRHAQDLNMAIQMRPKLIFCEKPISNSVAESERLVNACENDKISIAINYSRRWDSEVAQLREAIGDNRWGALRSIIGVYNKGILNNGSHMIDLISQLAGPLNVHAVGKPVYDHFSNDPTVPVWLEGKDGIPIHLVCANSKDYSMFEMQLIFSKKVISMEEGGLVWRERDVVDSDVFKGYRKLDRGNWKPGGYEKTMLNAIDNIYKSVVDGLPLNSNGTTGLDTERLCENILSQASQH